ncbi:MFS transporter [Amycolatopsis keratiniphila]|uniref:MFS transporter n=1 Tax=Amycolatopsis keratiniphila TaxID=129921 RepID=UPI003403F708
MRAYRHLFGFRGVPRLVLALIASRLAAPILNLSMLLAIVSVHGSYAVGGMALTGFSIALAVCVPVSGRLVDRFRPRPVLLGVLAVHALAYAAAVTGMVLQAPAWVLVGAAIALGASTPPSAPVIRSTWPVTVPAEHTRTAYALDAVLNEVMVVTGTLLVSVLVALVSPVAAVAVAGGCAIVGVLTLLTVPTLRAQAPTGAAGGKSQPRRALGPLADGQVRVLLGVAACDMLAFGCIVVGVSAAAASSGTPGLSGVLLGAYSVGAVISALGYGMWQGEARPRRQLVTFHAASAVMLVATGIAPELVLVGAAILTVGLVSGPRDTLHQIVLGDVAPPRQRTEAFAWMSTCMWVGNGIGTALAGQLVTWSEGDHTTTFLAAAAAATAAAGFSLFLRSTLRTNATTTQPSTASSA